MRFFQASGPLELAPGGFGSIVVAYIFAAPRIVGACTGPGTCDVKPGDPTRLSDPVRLQAGANAIDSVSGFTGYRGPFAATDTVFQDSITTVPGSLLGKALVAQNVFNNLFLLPFAPDVPDFFLIPGNNQVTVLWQPSASERPAIRSSRSPTARPRRKAASTHCTTRTTASSTWKAIGCIEAGWIRRTRSSCWRSSTTAAP